MVKKKTPFKRSFALLVIALICILGFVRGEIQQWLMVSAVGTWLLFLVCIKFAPKAFSLIRKAFAGLRIRREKTSEDLKTSFEVSDIFDSPEAVLIRHINHRITEKLRSVFGEAAWDWAIEPTRKFLFDGGTGRIRLFKAGEYNFAEITLDPSANIVLNLIKSVSFDALGKQGTAASAHDTSDIKEWAEMQCQTVLSNAISDLNSRGFKELQIHENGDVCILEDNKPAVQCSLENMPKKRFWKKLAGIFEDTYELETEITDKCIILSW